MGRSSPAVGIVGGGIGGLAAAIALRRLGIEATVFEQAAQFTRIGADVNLTPNSVRALDGLGIGDALRGAGARPRFRVSRTWDSGEETSRLEMSSAAEARYGAPQLTLHRADVLRALEGALPASAVRLGKKAIWIADEDGRVTIRFADGTTERFDVLVGADGIHSAVRAALFGEEHPRFTGLVAYRAVVPAERLSVPGLDVFTKWWGPNPASQIVIFPISAGREIFVFATTAQDGWQHESWTMPGSVAELRDAYAGFHPDALGVLAACEEVLKTALYERDPLPSWSRGGAALLGDSCHPMMPFMAQGAGMAIEDAVVLARCLAEAAPGESAAALRRYQVARHERASRIQIGSRGNAWLRDGGNADWVYGYDAWGVALPEGATAST